MQNKSPALFLWESFERLIMSAFAAINDLINLGILMIEKSDASTEKFEKALKNRSAENMQKIFMPAPCYRFQCCVGNEMGNDAY